MTVLFAVIFVWALFSKNEDAGACALGGGLFVLALILFGVL